MIVRKLISKLGVVKLSLVIASFFVFVSVGLYLILSILVMGGYRPVGILLSIFMPAVISIPVSIILLGTTLSLQLAEERANLLLEQIEKSNKELEKAYEELKKSEAELVQSEKMASLGILSAGIAHEIKNPLNIIIQGIEYIRSSLEDKTPVDIDACERIKKSAIRADNIIKSLMTFSRKSPLSFEETDLSALVEETLVLLEHQMSLKNIKIIRHIADIPKIRLDSNQIRQVLVNVLINASDAIKKDGTITISITEEKPYINIAIKDTGKGMPESTIRNIFDPFFTTKRDSGGTGLGLFVAKGIIEKHGGNITVESKENEGATVMISLPER